MRKTGCRIPCEYVVVTGFGQSSFDAGYDHWETGAYDAALLDAGIENFNVMTYTSVLPAEAAEVTMDDAKSRGLIRHGAVLECIKAQMDGERNERLTTGVGRIDVYRRTGTATDEDELVGGFAAEYEGNDSEEAAKKTLVQDLDQIFHRRYGGTLGTHNSSMASPAYYYTNVRTVTRSAVVDEDYGTCFTSLCFLTYLVPTAGPHGPPYAAQGG